ALGGTLFFLPLNLIQVQHYSATAAGAAFLPFILIIFLLSRWAGGLVENYGSKIPLVIGPLIAALGFALFMLPGLNAGYWTTFFPAVVVLGTGMAISVAPLTTAVMNAVPVAQSGIASGINNAISHLASLFAVGVFGLVLLTAFRHDLGRRLDQLALPARERQSIERQRSRLAAIQTGDPRIEHAVDEAFVFGFRRILWMAAALSLASAACAQVLT